MTQERRDALNDAITHDEEIYWALQCGVGIPTSSLNVLIAVVDATRTPASPVEAAADDLLAALQWALAELNGQTRYDEGVAEQQEENCYRLARAAIAKATGQQVTA